MSKPSDTFQNEYLTFLYNILLLFFVPLARFTFGIEMEVSNCECSSDASAAFLGKDDWKLINFLPERKNQFSIKLLA